MNAKVPSLKKCEMSLNTSHNFSNMFKNCTQAKECSCVTKDARKFDLRPKLDYAIKSCANWPPEGPIRLHTYVQK